MGDLHHVDLLALELLIELPVPELLDPGVDLLQVGEDLGEGAGIVLQLHGWELLDQAQDLGHAQAVGEVGQLDCGAGGKFGVVLGVGVAGLLLHLGILCGS